EIVGVVRSHEHLYPGELPQQAVYFPYRQRPRSRMTLLVRTAGDSAALLDPIRGLVHARDADVPAFDVQTMEMFYRARATAIGDVLVQLVGGMGLVGMTLTVIGLYGLVSYSVSRRTREIGIRIAVGATYARIVRMVLSQGMTPAWFGVGGGLILSAIA